MITKKVIEAIYKKYDKRPASPYDLNIGLLFSVEMDPHCINIDGNNITIDSISPDSPFHSLALNHINAILEFDREVAIVLPTSIVFLHKDSPNVNVHINMPKPSKWERLLYRRDAEA
ncbi:MAG: hypothetical protein K2M01_06805 [Paramuribaculum sp.]|nr:hypothetical protein [Paramuribaculum sp.]